jgi:molecular chaperone DnaJ
MERDYYETLGVKKDASADEIKNAYRQLALKYHPDRNSDKSSEEKKQLEEKFKEINEAYAVLSDPDKRRQYDTYGSDTFHQRFSQEDIFRGTDINEILRQMGMDFGFDNDIFSMFGFGGMGGSRRQARMEDIGNDILTRVNVTLQEAAAGTEKKIALEHVKACDRCKGAGSEPGSKTVTCDQCKGRGQVATTRRTPFGIIQTVSTCGKCGGAGKYFEKACKMCGGRGRVTGQDKIDIKIPKGVQSGMRLRVREMGDFGRDHTGDLYVDVNVQKDKNFRREGDDLYAELHVPFYIAAIGGSVNAPTLNGEESIKIEAGTQNGDVVSIKGRGMPHMNGSGSGNEVLTVVIDVPKHPSSAERELFEKFRDLDSGKKGEGKRRFFGVL